MIPLLGSLIAGILLGNARPGFIFPAAVPAALLFGGLMFRALRKQTSVLLPPLLFFAVGYLSIQPWQEINLPPHHIVHHADGTKKMITGTVLTSPVQKRHRLQLTLAAETVGNGNPVAVTGNIRVNISGEPPVIRKGDRLLLFGKLRPIRNFNNPGNFDYKQYMAFSGMYAGVYSRASHLQILAHQPPNPILHLITRLQQQIRTHLDRSVSGEPRQILAALLLGDRSGISDELRAAFNRSGAGHILAISGLHIGIIATVFFLFFTFILAWIPSLLWHAHVKKIAALTAILPILFYGILSGMSPSTQRAVIMVTIFLLAFPLQKEHELINTIAVAALLILTVFPPALFSISFQLSFTAVLAIVAGLSAIAPEPSGPDDPLWKKGLGKLYQFFLVSVLAALGTMPVVLYHFHQISLIGPITNLVVVPVIGFIVLPVGFLSLVLLPLSPFLSTVCLQFCGKLLAGNIDLIHWLAALPFAAVKTVTPSLFEILCIYALLICLLYLVQRSPGTPVLQSAKAKKTALVLAGALVLLLTADMFYWIHNRFLHDDLRVHMLDVGQGNAALLELPGGYTMLIDGGGFANNSIFDVGERVVAPFLWNRKINTIDTVVLSHPNSDHMNGLVFIAQNFHVRHFWSTDTRTASQSFQELQQTISEMGILHPSFSQLPRRQIINGVVLQILHPDPAAGDSDETPPDLNDTSLVLKVTFQNQSFLFPGDITAGTEKELVHNYGRRLAGTVLLAPHHGSKTSSSERFLHAVDPEYIVISCGWKNRFRMPHQIVLDRYAKLGCQLYRTDEVGCISMTTDGNELTFAPK